MRMQNDLFAWDGRLVTAVELESLAALRSLKWNFEEEIVKTKFFTTLANIISFQPEL